MPGQALRAAPRISRQSAHEVVIVLSPKDRPPLPPGDIPELSQGHSTARRIKPTKNSNIAIGNRTRDFECSAATNCAPRTSRYHWLVLFVLSALAAAVPKILCMLLLLHGA